MSKGTEDAAGVMQPPDGFDVYSEMSPFLDRLAPLFERREDNGWIIATVVQPHHCNRRGLAHGGLYSAIADVMLGKNLSRSRQPVIPLLTSSITVDFISGAKVGDLLQARCDFARIGRRMAFANGYLEVGDRVMARASAVFAVMERG